MTTRDFAYWLQGFFELNDKNTVSNQSLNCNQVNMIKRHLELVFVHDIDPETDGNNPHLKQKYNDIHDGLIKRC